MQLRSSILLLCALVALIGFNLACSCGFKEGYESISQWKTNGNINWQGPYSKTENAAPPDATFSFMNEGVTPWRTSQWDGPHSQPDKEMNDSMVMFANNKSSPECCVASSYSDSSGKGCICTTKEQLHFLNTRGGNRTTEDGF